MESRKMVQMDLSAGQEYRQRQRMAIGCKGRRWMRDELGLANIHHHV